MVSAATGEPLNKVLILAEGGSESGATPSTTTDAKGHFTLIDLMPGQVRLRGQRNGYLDGAYGARRADGNGTPLTLEPGQEIKDLQIKLTPFGVIAGTVRDADGEPMARITVAAHRLKFEDGLRHLMQAGGAYTDDLGQYRIPDLPPGRYYVYAENKKSGEFGSNGSMEQETEDHSPKGAGPPQTLLPTMYPGVQELGPGARITGVDIVLTRSTTVPVKGHAVAPPGMQLSNIELSSASAESDSLGLQLSTGANEKGEFEFRAVPPGSYTLTASATSAANKPSNGIFIFDMSQHELKVRMPLQVGTSAVQGLRVVVDPGAEVSGHIAVDGDDKVKIGGGFMEVSGGQSDSFPAMVSDDSTFKLILPAGHYHVLADRLDRGDLVVRSMQAQGRNILDEGLTISEPGKIALEIVMAHDGGRLDGTALDANDKPVPGATVVLAPEASLRARTDLFHQTESDQYGRFNFDGVVPGNYKLLAWDDVEPGMWWDPDFLKRYEAQAESVTLAVKGKATVKVHVAKQ